MFKFKLRSPKLSVSEAAAILLKEPWSHYVIDVPYTADGHGPANIGEDAASLVFEVWDAATFDAVASFDTLAKAHAHFLKLLIKSDPGSKVSRAASVIKAVNWPVVDMLLDANSRGPAVLGVNAARVAYHTWYDTEKIAMASFSKLSEATRHTLKVLSEE
jgi:hypothetical protein